MKRQVFTYAGVLLALTQSCNNTVDKVEEPLVVTDTIIKTNVVTVPAEVDTAAIIAFYESNHAVDKGVTNTNSKPKGKKKVSLESHPTFTTTEVITPTPPETQSGTEQQPDVKVVHDIQMFYFIPDEKAIFPGGEKAFDKYLLDNLEYPERALEAGVSRTVFPTLFLDEQGNPVNVEFRYEPTVYGFQDEARRILMKSPRWNPAKVNGKAVKSKFTIPITFKMAD